MPIRLPREIGGRKRQDADLRRVTLCGAGASEEVIINKVAWRWRYHAGSGDFSKRRKFSAAGTAERRYGKGGDSGDWADIRYGAMRGTDGKVQAGPLGRGKPLAPCPWWCFPRRPFPRKRIKEQPRAYPEVRAEPSASGANSINLELPITELMDLFRDEEELRRKYLFSPIESFYWWRY